MVSIVILGTLRLTFVHAATKHSLEFCKGYKGFADGTGAGGCQACWPNEPADGLCKCRPGSEDEGCQPGRFKACYDCCCHCGEKVHDTGEGCTIAPGTPPDFVSPPRPPPGEDPPETDPPDPSDPSEPPTEEDPPVTTTGEPEETNNMLIWILLAVVLTICCLLLLIWAMMKKKKNPEEGEESFMTCQKVPTKRRSRR